MPPTITIDQMVKLAKLKDLSRVIADYVTITESDQYPSLIEDSKPLTITNDIILSPKNKS